MLGDAQIYGVNICAFDVAFPVYLQLGTTIRSLFFVDSTIFSKPESNKDPFFKHIVTAGKLVFSCTDLRHVRSDRSKSTSFIDSLSLNGKLNVYL